MDNDCFLFILTLYLITIRDSCIVYTENDVPTILFGVISDDIANKFWRRVLD